MQTNLIASYRLIIETLVETLPVNGVTSLLRSQWLRVLQDQDAPLATIHDLIPYIHLVNRFNVPTAFLTLLREAPLPLTQPVVWAIDAEADTHNATVGRLALADSLCPAFWVPYAHPDWLWTPAGVAWLLWHGVIYQDDHSLTKAKTILAWLGQHGYGHLLLESAVHHLAPHVTPSEALIPPMLCPLSKADWAQAQALLPVLKRGLIIAASDCPSDNPMFGQVAQMPNNPWVIVHTGWLWMLNNWLHGGEGQDFMAVCDLLRQSIDTVVLHRMLTTNPETLGRAL